MITTWDTGTTDTFVIRQERPTGGQNIFFDFEAIPNRWEPFDFDSYPSVTYDEKEKRWEVIFHNGSVRYFATKRSALRFVKRLEDKENGVKKKKKPMTKSALRLKREEEENNYLERLGV